MTTYERMERVIRYIDQHQEEQPRLETLASIAGLSPFHFHRQFSRWAGTTPKHFLKFITSEHAKRLLAGRMDLLRVSLETGLSGPGRLHDLLVTVDGVTPGEFKAGGAGLRILYGFHETPFGEALIATTSRGVCHVEFTAGRSERDRALRNLTKRWPKASASSAPDVTAPVAKRMFARKGKSRIKLLLGGTPFQLKVWEALLRIPPGRAASYGEIAAAIGRPSASRAVGAAVGSNSIAYLIPCHRVIRSAGLVGDYRWGSARKRALLAWESAGARNPTSR
jgi:AraC family transcriptional regulator of adaptative response/methylated-DNA-[protein]-cysteine methyltransferase